MKTRHLLLREFRPSDWKAVHEYASDPQVVKYVVWGPNNPAQTRGFIRRCLRLARQKPRVQWDWAVIEKKTSRLVGGCSLTVISPKNREAMFGYCLRRDAWNRGYATQAAKAMVYFGFHALGLRRITSTCDVKNKASYKVMEKLGMRREAHFRKNVLLKDHWRDTYLYAVLRGGK
jgi:[ribosomal protein S5]-alanine N-acetyltransferase